MTTLYGARKWIQARAPGYPGVGGAQTPNGVRAPIIWQNLCRKLHENERIWTERERTSPVPPPPDPLLTVYTVNWPRRTEYWVSVNTRLASLKKILQLK